MTAGPAKPVLGATRGGWLRTDLGLLGLLACARLVLHLATVAGYGIFRDELYYLACADHLALGYVDHPPLSILLLWAERALLGDSLLAIRLLPAFAGAATVFVTGLMARELGGGRGAQVLAALAAFFVPFFLATSHFFSMNAFDVTFWAVLLLLAVRILGRDEPRLWLLFGLVAGLALQNKYTVGVLGVGLGVGLLLSGQRRHLRSPWLWLGGALALAILAPNLLWQILHGWPTAEFMANARAEKIQPIGILEFLAGQIVLLHPLSLPIWIAGLASLLFSSRLRPFRALGFAYVVMFATVLLQGGKVYYIAPAYTVLFAAGASTIDAYVVARGQRWVTTACALVLVLGGLAALPAALPLLPVESFIAYSRAIKIGEPQTERHERGVLPQLFADMHGWEELVDTVERVHRGLPPEDRDKVVVFARNYGQAGAIDFLGSKRGLPPAISTHNTYYLWGPGRYTGGVVIVLGGSEAELAEWFERVERADTVRCDYCMPHENDVPVWICRGLRIPVEEMWARLRRYI